MTELKIRIDTLEARLAKLRAHKARLEARQRASASRRERKDDARRKILLGAILQQKVAEGALSSETLRHWLDGALTRTDDRALFGLPPHETTR